MRGLSVYVVEGKEYGSLRELANTYGISDSRLSYYYYKRNTGIKDLQKSNKYTRRGGFELNTGCDHTKTAGTYGVFAFVTEQDQYNLFLALGIDGLLDPVFYRECMSVQDLNTLPVMRTVVLEEETDPYSPNAVGASRPIAFPHRSSLRAKPQMDGALGFTGSPSGNPIGLATVEQMFTMSVFGGRTIQEFLKSGRCVPVTGLQLQEWGRVCRRSGAYEALLSALGRLPAAGVRLVLVAAPGLVGASRRPTAFLVAPTAYID